MGVVLMQYEPVLHVYLDQNKWIDFARAANGSRGGERFVDALASSRAAVASGAVRFPLDMYRYAETGKRFDARSRHDVADVMLELSQQLTMAHSRDLLPGELDEALSRRFGRPEQLRSAEVFGIGLWHLTSGRVTLPGPDLSKLDEHGATIPPERVAEFTSVFNGILESEILRSGPESVPAGLATAVADIDKQYVDFENMIAANIRDRGLYGEDLELAVRASDLGGIRAEVTEALGRIDLTWDVFIAELGADGLRAFMDDVPTRRVTNVMRSAKLRQSEQLWEPNDFNDLLGLAVAAVYCDVVVTEKQWVHHLRQKKIDEKYSTVLLSDAADLEGIVGHLGSAR